VGISGQVRLAFTAVVEAGEVSSESTAVTTERLVDAMCDFAALLDFECGDFPEGITDAHRRVAARCGYKLPEEAST